LFEKIDEAVPEIESDLLWSILVESLRHACEERAFDPEIETRRRSDSYTYSKWVDPDEAGIPHGEIIPEYVQNSIADQISEEELNSLRRALMTKNPMLFQSDVHGNYLVNPEATTIELRLDDNWYRCEGCHRFSVVSLNGECPHDGCTGSLEEVGDDDIHLQARKNFLRNPPQQVLHGERDPLTLRSEEPPPS